MAKEKTKEEVAQPAEGTREWRWAAFLKTCETQEIKWGRKDLWESRTAAGEFNKIPDSFQ